MSKIREALDRRYAARPVRLSARVATRPVDSNGQGLNYVIAEVAGVPGVRVNVAPGVVYYPGDIILVEQRGAAAAAAYEAVGWTSGARPDAGVLEFTGNTTIGTGTYDAGDLLWGNPFTAHFHMDYSAGQINLKAGSTLTGRIDAGTGKFTAGDPSGLHGVFGASGISFLNGSTNVLLIDGTNGIRQYSSGTQRSWFKQDGSGWLAGADKLTWDTSGNISLSGAITAASGSIGGWTIDAAKIYQTNAHLNSSGYVSFGATPPTAYGNNVGAWLGYSSGAKFSLYASSSNYLQWDGSKLLLKAANTTLDASGNLTASNVSLSGAITATSGSVTGSLYVGSAAPRIHVDGTNKLLESTNFVSGSTGFRLDGATGNAEFGNITARGTIKTAVFEKSLISAFAGSQIVAKSASSLYEACTVSGTTFTLKVLKQAEAAPFANTDIVRLKSATVDTWATVNAGTDQTTHWQYTATYQNGSTSGTLPAGHAVVDYGQSGQGYYVVSADGLLGASAAWALCSHAGAPWTTETTHVYAGTDGRFYAGAGDVTLDNDGIRMGYGLGLSKRISWVDGATEKGYIACNDGMIPGSSLITLSAVETWATGAFKCTDAEVSNSLLVYAGAMINASAGDYDVTIRGDTATNLLVCDAGLDAVLIGTTSAGVIADFRTGGIVLNENGADRDTRIEGDTDVNLVFVDAGADRVGIGTNAPNAKLDVRGSVIINDAGENHDTRIEGDTDVNLVFVDASTDRVGIGTANPLVKLDVRGNTLVAGNIGLALEDADAYIMLQSDPANNGNNAFIWSDDDLGGLCIAATLGVPDMRIQDGASEKAWIYGGVGYTGNLRPRRGSTTYTANAVVPLTTAATSTSYDGDAISTGTYQLDLSASPWNLPAEITGVFVRLASMWAAANNSSFALLRPYGGSGSAVVVRANVANIYSDSSGFIPCGSGDIELVVSGANTAETRIEIWGYTL